MAEINFDGLQMIIRSENLKTRNVKEYKYFESKDFEKVFQVPQSPMLKRDVEDSLIDVERGDVIGSFLLPFNYEKEDVEEYKKFLADAFDKIRKSSELKFVEIRRSVNQKIIIIVEQK